MAGNSRARGTARYRLDDEVDFVVVGSGAAGGVMAKELSTAGFQVVVLEQGPRLGPADFRHDEVETKFAHHMTNDYDRQPNTFRKTESQKAKVQPALVYARVVGGSSVHFTANFWRFREADFIERSRRGAIAGTGFADWPITYAELEPHYTKVDWEIGVSGLAGADPGDSFRSKPYPVPPLPIKSSGVLLERAAKKLGLRAIPAPMAILSQPFNGRNACQYCGYCEFFGCEFGAKSSTLASVIPVAEATGRCEIRSESYVRRIEHGRNGRVTGAVYFDANGREQFQRAKAVVLCANGGETPRLLLLSAGGLFPQGLANSSGLVGKYLMFNSGGISAGVFEHPLNDYKGFHVSRVILDYYELSPKLGFYGGGGIDARFDQYPITYALDSFPKDAPRWGAGYKALLRDFPRTMYIFGHATSLPVASNSVSLDPSVKDAWGLPAIRLTYRDHPDDLKVSQFFVDRGLELLDAAGALKKWHAPVEEQTFGFHLLGTCRMGNDPKTSVVNKFHRAHDVPNLFICDGSSFVTSGRGQPTMTIQALAFRAGEHIAGMARRGEI